MKKTQQIFVVITSLVALTFFVGNVHAQVCTGDYTIDEVDTAGDIASLSGCTEITGSLIIEDTALTDLTGLENLTAVEGSLHIWNNPVLTSLNGLNNFE